MIKSKKISEEVTNTTTKTTSTPRKNEKTRRINTGIDGFDKLTLGGFKHDSINLISGAPGSGKTIFAIQFLVTGLKKGEAGIYVTFEEKKEGLYEDMLEFGWDLKKYEDEKKFVFLEYTPEQVKKVLIEGGGTIDAIIKKLKVKRLVIDSISSFALLYEDELTRKQASLALFELINNWGCTAVLTSQSESKTDVHISSATDFEVDTIILAYHIKKKGHRIRAIEILKMRGTNYPEKTVTMNIIPKKGIVINPNEVISF